MYYRGTKEECAAYNNQVKQGENYDGILTINWCLPIECKGYWAVIANEKYYSSLQLTETIEILIKEI